MPSLKSFLFLLALLSALPSAGAEPRSVTLSIPGLYAPTVDEETRELWSQQLAASLEGEGFTVLDAAALTARDIEVPPQGCYSPLPPLCGAGPGVEQVILGSVAPAETEGQLAVTVELVDARSRRSLWAGRFEAGSAEEVGAGLVTIATAHLPAASRREFIDKDPPVFLGVGRRQWGIGLTTAGLLSVTGGIVLASHSLYLSRELATVHRPLMPWIDSRDALRMRDQFKAEVIGSVTLGAVGLATVVTGLLVMQEPAEQEVSLQFVPSHDSGMLVFSGRFH